MLNNIQAVLFDLDGTLVDSVPDLTLAINQTVQPLGIEPYTKEIVKNWIGNGSRKLFKRALTGELNGEPDEQLFEESFPIFLESYAANLSAASHLYDGVLTTLESLKKSGIKMACVTNKPIQFVPPVLEAFNIEAYFPVVVGGGSVAELKPSAEPLLSACNQLGVKPENALMIGDSSSDIKAAKAAGMESVAVDYGYSQGVDLLALGAKVMVSNLEDILIYE